MSSTHGQSQPPLDYSDSGPGILIGSYVLAFVTTIVVALRFWAKRLTSSPLRLDDYLILSCLLVHHFFIVFGTVAVVRGGLGRDMRIIAQDPTAVVILFKFIFMVEVTYGFSCTLVKLSVLAFYLRVFPTRTIRITSAILIFTSISWTIAVQVVHVIQCRPLKAFWYQNLQRLPETKCIDIILFLMGNSIANCVVDFCTIVMPVQEVLKLHMSRSRKISVCVIFLLGGTAFAASMTRTLSTARMQREGTYNFTKQSIAPGVAAAVEVYVAIVGACLPTLIPIYRKLRWGHPNAPKRPTPVDGIVTIGKLSNRNPFGSGVKGSSKKFENEEKIMFSPCRGSCQVSISGQGKQLSLRTDSSEYPLQGIVVKQDVTWSENGKSVI